eukprot:6600832-Pyramimonas_sp.AAC.1
MTDQSDAVSAGIFSRRTNRRYIPAMRRLRFRDSGGLWKPPPTHVGGVAANQTTQWEPGHRQLAAPGQSEASERPPPRYTRAPSTAESAPGGSRRREGSLPAGRLRERRRPLDRGASNAIQRRRRMPTRRAHPGTSAPAQPLRGRGRQRCCPVTITATPEFTLLTPEFTLLTPEFIRSPSICFGAPPPRGIEIQTKMNNRFGTATEMGSEMSVVHTVLSLLLPMEADLSTLTPVPSSPPFRLSPFRYLVPAKYTPHA